MFYIFIIWFVGFLVNGICVVVGATLDEEYTFHHLCDDIVICVGSWVSFALIITTFFVDDFVLFTNTYDDEL